MTQNRASWLESNASQSFLVEASERLASARSMPAVVEVLRDTARGAIGADGIAVVLKDGDQCSYVAEDAIAFGGVALEAPPDKQLARFALDKQRRTGRRRGALARRQPESAQPRPRVRLAAVAADVLARAQTGGVPARRERYRGRDREALHGRQDTGLQGFLFRGN